MTMTDPVVPDDVTASGPTAIRLEGVSKAFGSRTDAVVALDGIDLEVRRGEFLCLVGASGCGKSTMLNLIAGLDRPTVGHVDVHGKPAFMFQEAALFPWLKVIDNVAIPLRLRGVGKKERYARAEELLELVHLEGQGQRRPHELSGGMRQRVALARSLAQDADILLMDEPFGALDAMTRDILHEELERIWQTTGLTVVFVTHNVREAARLGDRIVLLTSRPGKVAEEFVVDNPRPRRIDSPEVSTLAARITDRLREEVRRHGR
ncbi:MAG: putative transporter ATP-binding protein [Actinomycetia bacterium]|nr:putative transporter ATP-binding protein [Actinomycetes bacterium]